MSATARSEVRHPDDFYVTPAWAVQALLGHIPRIAPGSVLVPGCGKGAILDALRDSGRFDRHALRGIEVNRYRARVARRRHDVRCADFLESPWTLRADTVVMNPPYKLALPFVEESLGTVERAGGCVHALLRLGFLASVRRRDWWQTHPADVLVLSRRPSFCHTFTCSGCRRKRQHPVTIRSSRCSRCRQKMARTTHDAADYGWFSWGPGPRGRVTIA